MPQKVIICFVVMLSSISFAWCQNIKKTETLQQFWFGYFNQTKLTEKWGLWFDLQLRTKDDFTKELYQFIGRLGAIYYLNDATKLMAGYAYANHFPIDNHKKISQPEHRFWQQIQWQTLYGKKKLMQSIRLEERFRHKILNDSALAGGYHFNYKIRYNILYEIPLSKKGIVPGALSLILNNDVHINFGKQVVYNYFDQNRMLIGLKIQINTHDNFQVGYMNLFQQSSSGNSYKNIHAIRFSYFNNLTAQ